MDIASVDELLTTTRSVRKRLDLNRPVGREVILECIRLAMQAPTASNAQDWRWLVITDADKRAAIADIYRGIGAEYLALRGQGRDRSADAAGLHERTGPDRHAGPSSRARHPMPGQPHRQLPCADRRVGLGVDHPGRLELLACPAVARVGVGVDDDAPGEGGRGGRVARHSGHRHAGRAVPGGLHDRHRLPPGHAAAGGDDHLLGHLGERADAVLHRAIPRRRAAEEGVAGASSAGSAGTAPRPRVLKWPTGSMEILNEGNEAGEGLVRTCIFEVPKYLLSGGRARSWETVTEAELNKLSRYVAVGAPLWSRAEGYHQLEEQPDGTTVLTFHETYHAYNPVLRFFLERPVHAKISRDNLKTYEHALGYAGKVRRLT